MATVYNFARMAADIYSDTTDGRCRGLPWWRRDPMSNQRGISFQAAPYVNTNQGAKEVVISFRGTEPTKLGDLATDGQIGLAEAGGLAMTPSQLPAALDAFDYWHSYYTRWNLPVAVTGHSLGGYLAGVVAILRGVPCVTFNAPFYRRTALRLVPAKRIKQAHARILNVRATGDPINLVNDGAEAIGRVLQVPFRADHESIPEAVRNVNQYGAKTHSIDRMAYLVGLLDTGHKAWPSVSLAR